MGVGACDGGMAHPYLLIGPSFQLRARAHRLAKQRPLHAVSRAIPVRQIERDIPPLDAKIRMRTMIGREGEPLARDDGCKSITVHAKSGKALGQNMLLSDKQRKRAAGKAATGDPKSIAHWQRP
jgi:hypothetical protein